MNTAYICVFVFSLQLELLCNDNILHSDSTLNSVWLSVWLKEVHSTLGHYVFKCVCAGFIQDVLGFIQDALGFIQDVLGFIQDALGFIQDALGFIQDALGFIQDALGFIQDALGFIQDALGFIQDVLGFNTIFCWGGGGEGRGIPIKKQQLKCCFVFVCKN